VSGRGATDNASQRLGGAVAPWVVGGFRWHARAFVGLNAVLSLINVATGAPWWAFWPLAATGFLLGLHYLLYKAMAVDETWAAERVEELNLKSYDRSHIEELKSRHSADASARPDDRRAS
jgi:hypothetical protein